MKGQLDIEKVLGIIITTMVIMVIIPILNTIPSSISTATCDRYIREIEILKNQVKFLENKIANKEDEIKQLIYILSSFNVSLKERDMIIFNLTNQLNIADKKIKNLTEELNRTIAQLNYYKEREYIEEIHNYFYNISNYLAHIENRFFPIEVSMGLISFTLISVVIKVFHLDKIFVSILKQIKHKRRNGEKNKSKSDTCE